MRRRMRKPSAFVAESLIRSSKHGGIAPLCVLPNCCLVFCFVIGSSFISVSSYYWFDYSTKFETLPLHMRYYKKKRKAKKGTFKTSDGKWLPGICHRCGRPAVNATHCDYHRKRINAAWVRQSRKNPDYTKRKVERQKFRAEWLPARDYYLTLGYSRTKAARLAIRGRGKVDLSIPNAPPKMPKKILRWPWFLEPWSCKPKYRNSAYRAEYGIPLPSEEPPAEPLPL